MNSGNSIARFYNVVETSGNIFELWEQQTEKKVVEKCNRYFISLDEAVGLIMFTMDAEAGRYSVNPGTIRNMKEIYFSKYGNNPYISMEPRRGDRITELLHSTSERIIGNTGTILQIESYHDDRKPI